MAEARVLQYLSTLGIDAIKRVLVGKQRRILCHGSTFLKCQLVPGYMLHSEAYRLPHISRCKPGGLPGESLHEIGIDPVKACTKGKPHGFLSLCR